MEAPTPPPHPLPALTTYELSRYRRQLEHALKALPGHAPVRGQLQQRLAEVMAEQHSRTQTPASDRARPPPARLPAVPSAPVQPREDHLCRTGPVRARRPAPPFTRPPRTRHQPRLEGRNQPR